MRGRRRLLVGAIVVLGILTWIAAAGEGTGPAPRTVGPARQHPQVSGQVSAAPTVVPTPARPRPGPSTPPPASATPTADPAAGPVVEIRYRMEIVSPDPAVADAADIIPAVLEDPRGWQRAGFDFVLDPTAPHLIVLAEGDDAQQRCQPYDVGGEFSCQIGATVVLNAIRWREGVPHWPAVDAAGLHTYRTMLVNHEVGHLLGMHHLRCAAPGAVAPVMEQQSGTLRGCAANAWPTEIEIRLASTHQFELAPGPLDVPHEP